MARLAKGGGITSYEKKTNVAMNLLNKKYFYGIDDFLRYRQLSATAHPLTLPLSQTKETVATLIEYMTAVKSEKKIINQLKKNLPILNESEASLGNTPLLVAATLDRNGIVEWLIVGGFLFTTLTLFSRAQYEWRRAAPEVA